MPEQQVIDGFYNDNNYFQGDILGGYTNYDTETQPVIPQFQALLNQIPLKKNAAILDIGCAYGTHLSIAANQSLSAWGVEISKPARKIALERHGSKINVVESIESLPKIPFDLIVLLDVIEHLPSPYPLFSELIKKNHIDKHTKIAITTPNARSIEAIHDPSNWRYRYAPAHMVYYSAKTLSILFKRLKFNKITIHGTYASVLSSDLHYKDEHSYLNKRLACYSGTLCIAHQLISKSNPL